MNNYRFSYSRDTCIVYVKQQQQQHKVEKGKKSITISRDEKEKWKILIIFVKKLNWCAILIGQVLYIF